jgi:hypothetical protein
MRLGVALCALLGIGPSVLARAEPARMAGRAEVGVEYDSNPGRAETVEGDRPRPVVPGSPLGRFVLTGDLAAIRGRQALALSAGLAGKVFQRAEARAEDVLVADASGSWSVRVAERTRLALAGTYYDVFQRAGTEARDFRYVTPALRLEQAVGEAGALAAGVGYRWFTYKPDAQLDFTAPTAFAVYRQTWPGLQEGAADWEWSALGTGELREFQGQRCTAEACPAPGQGQRRDQFFTLQVEATRTGDFLLGAGLAGHLNLSNSYGDQLARGLVHVRAVFLLPAELTLSARGELVFTSYRDEVTLVPDFTTGTQRVSIEDEGRSTLRVELARPFGPHVDLGLRYTFYGNEAAGGRVHYRRHTALLFIALQR